MTKTDVNTWKAIFEAKLRDARAKFVPKIVLWGPAKENTEGFAKRQKVAGAISEEAQASVLYPEDPDVHTMMRKYSNDLDLQEVFEAAAADLVFALDVSPGVSEEIARYSLHKGIARHLIIIAPESKRNGYGAIIRRTLKVQFLREEDLKVCDVASAFCQTEVRSWLIGKLLEEDLAYVS